VARGARLSSAVVESGATVEAGALVQHSIVLAGARIGAGAEVRDSIVGPGVVLPPRARIQRRVVVVAQRGLVASGNDSHVEGLLFSPLDAPRRSENPGL
jgi:mannose-1-phosphate guanylyltransferase